MWIICLYLLPNLYYIFSPSNFKSLLWIRAINPLYMIYLENIFSKFIKCLWFYLWFFHAFKKILYSQIYQGVFFFFLIASDFTIVGPLVATLLDRSQGTWQLDQNYEVEKGQVPNWKYIRQRGAANMYYRKISDCRAPAPLFLS